jgi:hypothetical protein
MNDRDINFFVTPYCPYSQMVWIALNIKATRKTYNVKLHLVEDPKNHNHLNKLGYESVPTL